MPRVRVISLIACMAASAAATQVQADVCFTVLDRANRTIYQSRTAPVDMSRQIGDTLYQRFPDASVMVFGQNNATCEEVRGAAGPGGFGAIGARSGRTAPASGAGPDMTQFFNERRYAPRS